MDEDKLIKKLEELESKFTSDKLPNGKDLLDAYLILLDQIQKNPQGEKTERYIGIMHKIEYVLERTTIKDSVL